MLSLHTNAASLAARSALGRSSDALSTSQTRLGTGYRVNSAMDDAAGLQIATRLEAQSSGMTVAMRNAQNSISMLQTADSLMDEVGTILTRIKDLATQAADSASTQADRDAMHGEYVALSEEIYQIVKEAPYAGQPLIRYTVPAAGVQGPGTLGSGPMKFQIGATASETMTTDFRPFLGQLNVSLYYAIDNGHLFGSPVDGPGTELTVTTSANALIDKVADALNAVGAVRTQIGATSNRLESVFNNLSNMQVNTKAARGRIVDADYASETANMTRNQMLMQSGTAMLKQSDSVSQLVLSLVQ